MTLVKSTALLALAATACASETRTASESPLAQGDERVIDGLIDGSSTAWASAPFPHEAARECPLAEEVPILPMLVFEHLVEASDDIVVDVSLEGSSVDPSLTGEPELIVYRGDALPMDETGARDCEGAAKPGGGEPGVVTGISLASGERLLVVAYTDGTTGFPGDDAGTFRVQIRAR